MPAWDETGEEEEVEETEEESTEETEESTEEESTDDDEAASKEKKRISDLQSAKDKETARANKAEAALKKLTANKGNEGGSDNPETSLLMQELREAALDAVFGEYPVLKTYGIDRSLIEGATRAQVRESASSVVSLIKSVSTKVRNEVLAENGLSAGLQGNSREKPVDYGSMSDEAFLKMLDS